MQDESVRQIKMVAIFGIKTNEDLPPQLCRLSTTAQAYHDA